MKKKILSIFSPQFLNSIRLNLFLFFLIFCFLVSFFILLIPYWREKVKSFIPAQKPKREILSSLSSRLFSDKRFFRILKVKTHRGLFIEVYKHSIRSKPPLLFDRIKLPDSYNGYFHVRQQAVSLSVFDINNDKKLEILAPSFDQDLTAHLNIYTYNEKNKRFEDF